jgi:hypothetical protein
MLIRLSVPGPFGLSANWEALQTAIRRMDSAFLLGQTDEHRMVAAGSSYRPPASAGRSRKGTGYPAAASTPLRDARTRV